MNLEQSVNSCISEMQRVGGMGKGVVAEEAVFQICADIYQKCGGILYHSYEYAVDKDLVGNIKRGTQGNFYLENLGSTTEIDILLVTPFKIFPIEVKAYKAKKLTLTDSSIEGCYVTDKVPVHQNEMHCRHLYSHIYRVLPNGESSYIVPIVVFADQCDLIDNRSKEQKNYILALTLNKLKSCITKMNKPGKYRLDLPAVDKALTQAKANCKKYLKVRELK